MDSLYRQIFRFGVTGFINTIIDYGLFNMLVYITGIHEGWRIGLINMLAVGLAATNSYLMNRNWTFISDQQRSEQPVLKFVIASTLGMLINSLVVTGVSYLSPWMHVSVYLVLNGGKILGACFSSTWNFVLYRYWVFKPIVLKYINEDVFPPIIAGVVTIIIPAYNESARLPKRLRRLAESVINRYPVEILVIDDGSNDDTFNLCQRIADDFPFIRCLKHNNNMGKGAAVHTGIVRSQGEYVVFVDADETFTLEHIEQIIAALHSGSDVAIAVRHNTIEQRIAGESRLRRLMGKSFNILVQAILLPGFHDTQCGLKGFKRKAAQQIFIRQKLNGFAFDVEILALARSLNLEIVQVAVQAIECTGSRVNRLISPLQMAWDLLRIRLNLELGHYGLIQIKEPILVEENSSKITTQHHDNLRSSINN
ncbi:MAG: glycosyltransferase [Syntrophomonas sp.]|nr:glycosyltransferase [Syntrophomonas sp.]